MSGTKITPDERAAMRHLASVTTGYWSDMVPRLLDALDTAEAEVGRLRAVRPDREGIYRAWHGTDEPWGGCADSASIERVRALWPGESRATMQAEALRDAADTIERYAQRADVRLTEHAIAESGGPHVLREYADRLEQKEK